MNNPKVSIIVALDDKNGIGKDNALMWHIPEELKHFKSLTTGHPIIMGRKTHESIGRPLPNRTNIIITRDKSYQSEGCIVVHSLEEAIEKATSVIARNEAISINNKIATSSTTPRNDGDAEPGIFIIGGGEIYSQAMERGIVDKIYLTKVQGDFKATVFFPDYSDFSNVINESDIQVAGEYKYKFLELVGN